MGISDIIIILLCAVIIILLIAAIVLLLRKSGEQRGIIDLDRQTKEIKEHYDRENRLVLDQISRQNSAISDAVKQNVEILGGTLKSEQKNAGDTTAAALDAIGKDISGMKKENKESLDNIRSIVTDKMQDTLNSRLDALHNTITNSFTELGKGLREEQKNQLNIINQNMDRLRRENSESLEKINGTVNEKLQESLDKRITESFRTVNDQLMNVSRGLGEMQSVAVNITDLKKVLSNVKTRGNFGEVQLKAILEEILTPEQYDKQVNVSGTDSSKVDFVVRLPGADGDEPVLLPIDAKFPGDTYSALADAINSGSTDEADECRRKLYATIREEAKSISAKYICPPRTTDFAVMFLPSEGLYSEAVSTPGLVEELQRKYKVNIAGPSTMAALLNSLRMGFQTLRIQQKSAEIQKVLEAAKKEFGNFSTVLKSTRDKLRQADENLEKLVTTRSNAINRALKGITETENLDDAQNIIDTN